MSTRKPLRPAAVKRSRQAPLFQQQTLHALRTVVVYDPDGEGQPDLDRPAYALHRVEVAGRCTYLRANELTTREFTVTVVPPDQLIWGHATVTPQAKPSRWLNSGLLWKFVLAMAVVAALGAWHVPADAAWHEVGFSRYALVEVLLLGWYLWWAGAAHAAASSVRVETALPLAYCSYPLKPSPMGFKAGVSSVSLGDSVFTVMQGRASEVVHWLHPGPEVDDAHYNPRTLYRFEVEGRRFEGQTRRQLSAQPFIVAGDLLRMAVEPDGRGGYRVVALANLSDGHLVIDESDERVSSSGMMTAWMLPFAFMGLLALPVMWLIVGPRLDEVTGIVAGLVALGAAVCGLDWWLRGRERRVRLLRALGCGADEVDARSIWVAPLPMSYF